MIKPWRIVLLFVGLWLCAGRAIAQQPDLEGSKDHPLISRYPGSYIRNYLQKEFDEFELPLGKLTNENSVSSSTSRGKNHLHLVRGPE